MKNFSRVHTKLTTLLAAGASIALWLALPSDRWGGRMWAVGSSVCHQIPSHSLNVAGVQFPICARCAGLYLGSLLGLVYFGIQGKQKAPPRRPFLLILLVLLLAWAGDGLNSFISDLVNRPFLYETSNITRLGTGFGMGLVMSTALTTLFNIVIWQEGEARPVLHSGWQIVLYVVLVAVCGFIFWYAGLPLFRLLSILSILTILVIISALYTIFWVIVMKKENRFNGWGALSPFVFAGLATALAQILLLNLIRLRVIG
jgi:uncharacterized membrane protein